MSWPNCGADARQRPAPVRPRRRQRVAVAMHSMARHHFSLLLNMGRGTVRRRPHMTRERRNMSYYIATRLALPFDDAVSKVVDALKDEGFGVLTEIDVGATLKKKLDVDFRRYRILGACNPQFAYRALQSESMIGTMLPCNVIVQEAEGGGIDVAAVDPIASMQAIDNPQLGEIAVIIREKLQRVIDSLN
jgi:uncharacterized protein (DUF302 family)